MFRIAACVPLLLLWIAFASARGLDETCEDSLDPVIARLAQAVGETDGQPGYSYCAFASGAALSVGYRPDSGLHLPLKQILLWPGNVFSVADSNYLPGLPGTTREAHEILLSAVTSGSWCMIYAREPVVVYAVDSSFGDPWYFVARCAEGRLDTTIWDASDFRARWWWWTDWPGVNTIWPIPRHAAPELGRVAVNTGMRNLVLAARPDSTAGARYGLAALEAARAQPDGFPGLQQTLLRMAVLRSAAADFIAAAVDLWPPARREPISLAAYYLRKDAEAWRTLAAAAFSWQQVEEGERIDILSGVLEWETRAAVALDEIVSQARDED